MQLFIIVFVAVNFNWVKGESDPSLFKCSAGQFLCPSEKCIPDLWRCDGTNDCGDNSDEEKCTPATCKPNYEFACKSGKCIPKRWRCDGEKECPDGSDEANCDVKCAMDFLRCNGTTKCIPTKWYCDGAKDCVNGADEINCPDAAIKCKDAEFQCDSKDCIQNVWRCDGDKDCTDGSDEKDCEDKIAKKCSLLEHRCTNGDCIPITFLCNGITDCVDKSDESNCTTITVPPRLKCGDGMWQCNSGDCILSKWKCDGAKDCADGSDEKICGKLTCSESDFSCKNGLECIAKYKKCDDKKDCADGSDELNCVKPTITCEPDGFICKDGTCIDKDKVCNTKKDCQDGEDESMNCFINECEIKNGHCSHTCIDSKIGYYCECPSGYKLSNDNRTCDDLNECETYGICHQRCTNLKGKYKCECVDGYLLEDDERTCKAIGSDSWLYFANGFDIRRKSLKGDHYDIALKDLQGAVSFDFDIKNNKIYLTDVISETIQSAKLDEPSSLQIVLKNVHTPDGLAVDWVTEKLYWTDTGYKTIEVADLDGQNNMDLVYVGLSQPRAIALDPSQGYLYWSDWGKKPAIEKISMDGTTDTRVQLVTKDIVWPNGITLDIPQRKIYWIDGKLKKIEVANMVDGSNRKVIRETGIVHPFALDNFEDKLYWSDWMTHGIRLTSKFDSKIFSSFQGRLKAPMDVKVYDITRQTGAGINPCAENNNGCSNLCLLANKDGKRSVSCACPRNMTLEMEKRCIGIPVTRPPRSAKNNTVVTSTVKAPSSKKSFSQQSTNNALNSTSQPKIITMEIDAQKYSGTTRKASGATIGIIIAVLFVITLAIIVIIMVLRRRSSRKNHIMYYKDMSTTPLEDDFDGEHYYNADKTKVIAENFPES